jgi:hypothetical protein
MYGLELSEWLRKKSDREQPSVRLDMCERSPLGLPHTQNRMSGRPQDAEILLMSSPQTLRVCGDRKKGQSLWGRLDGWQCFLQTVRNCGEREDGEEEGRAGGRSRRAGSLFSMFNATFGKDQRNSFGDYLELTMQSQYNKRNLERELFIGT